MALLVHLSRSIGATRTFSVTVSNTSGPVTYQWRHADTALSNATNAILTLTNLQLADAGLYTVTATDARGSTDGAPSALDVDPTWTKITSDPLVADSGDHAVGSWADLNGDGYLDLLLVRAGEAEPNALYRNNGDGSFTRIMMPSLQSVLAVNRFYCWGDYDNDGDVDLFVPEGMNLPLRNLLYQNNGDETFNPVTESPVVMEGGLCNGAAWGDFNRDGWLDLCLANGSASGEGSPAPQRNSLYRNQGDGTLAPASDDRAGPIRNDWGYFALPMWVDVNNDGWQDLFIVSTEGTDNPLYLNQQGNGFSKVTDDPLTKEIDIRWGDAAWADFDNDGDLDVFLTTARGSTGITAPGPVALFRNDGHGHVTKLTAAEIGPIADERVDTYVCCWGDYDNDGWLDLYFSNTSNPNVGADRTDRLYRNQANGTFSRVTRGSPVNELGAAFGGWLVDVNHDGFLDLVALKPSDPDGARVRYYQNNKNANGWLSVRCRGTASPRLATGTKVRVKANIGGKAVWQLRVIDPGGFANAQNFIAHFGLGDATTADIVRIEWTSGTVQELKNVSLNQHLTVSEPTKLSMSQPGVVQVQCWEGMAYQVEGSGDLRNWASLWTAV